MGANPYPVDPEAHHIFGVNEFNTDLGKRLTNWGIDLNSKQNGVYLPRKDYSGRVASIHRGRPSNEYTQGVTQALERAKDKEEALKILNDIKQALLEGKLRINNAE